MKLSMPSFARKLSLPSPKRSWSGKQKRSLSRSEAPSFASASSSSSSSDSTTTPRSVLPPAHIPRRELEAVLRRLGHDAPSDDDMDAVAAIAAEPPAPGAEDDLVEAFRVFDADGDGRITAEELRAVMEAILGDACTLDDCRRMIGGVDADGDGFVGFKDFERMMMNMNAAAAAAATTSDARTSFVL